MPRRRSGILGHGDRLADASLWTADESLGTRLRASHRGYSRRRRAVRVRKDRAGSLVARGTRGVFRVGFLIASVVVAIGALPWFEMVIEDAGRRLRSVAVSGFFHASDATTPPPSGTATGPEERP